MIGVIYSVQYLTRLIKRPSDRQVCRTKKSVIPARNPPANQPGIDPKVGAVVSVIGLNPRAIATFFLSTSSESIPTIVTVALPE
jgi:hypothetical protein